MTEKTVRVVGEVLAERQRQDERLGPLDDYPIIWQARLSREVGDVAGAVLEERAYRMAEAARSKLVDRRREIRAAAIRLAATAVALAEYLDRHTCRSCGCTDEAGCPNGCWWTEPGLCSNCFLEGCQKFGLSPAEAVPPAMGEAVA